MVQANEDVMSRPSECDSRPSTSGSGPFLPSKGETTGPLPRWPGGARPKVFNHRSFSSGSRPSVLSRASGSICSGGSNSRLGSRGSLLSETADDCASTNSTSRLRRELPSISDICGYDEVQELLRDIETLECCRWNSDWETFTIQSSHPDLELPHEFEIFGCRDPDSASRCESRLSWDSHGGRQHDDRSTNSSSRGSSPSGRNSRRIPIPTLTLAWDDSHLKTSVGIFRLLLVVVSVITMTCACTVGTARLSIFVLPGAWRLRIVVFTAVFSILTTTVLILLHLSSLVHSLTLRWDKLVTATYVFICVCYFVSASLLLHLLHLYHTTYLWIPAWSKQQLLTTSLCSCACGVVSLVLAVISGFGWPRYGRVLSDSSTTDTTSSHHLHTFHQISSSGSGVPLIGGSKHLRESSSLGHTTYSQQITTTFTPDSLEPQPGPSKPLPQNHTQARSPYNPV